MYLRVFQYVMGLILGFERKEKCRNKLIISKLRHCDSGERGIRTPGTSQYVGFQDRCNRPLCHLSNMFVRPRRFELRTTASSVRHSTSWVTVTSVPTPRSAGRITGGPSTSDGGWLPNAMTACPDRNGYGPRLPHRQGYLCFFCTNMSKNSFHEALPEVESGSTVLQTVT